MMKKTSRGRIAVFSATLLGALVVCSGARGQDVKTRYMPGTDFSKYHTYCWVSADGTGVPDQIIDQQIKRAIDAQMAAKGLTKVDCDTPDSSRAAGVPQPPNLPELPGPKQLPGLSRSEGEAQPAGGSQPSGPRYALNSAESPAHKADLLLAYHVAIRQETQWNAFGSGWGGFPAGLGGWGTGTATATSSSIDVGTLVLNMYDPAAKQLVWAGNATKTISLSKNQDKNQRNLEKAMQKLLKDWPR